MPEVDRARHGVWRLTPVVTAGVIIGVIEVVIAFSFAALLFSGSLAEHAAVGTGLVLASAVAIQLGVGALATRAGTAGSVQDVPAVFLAAAFAQAAAVAPPDARLATVVAVGVLACVATGAVFLALGWLRLGRLVRFLPYSVVGGFLAGTGVLLIQGGLSVAAAPVDGWMAGLGDASIAARWLAASAVLVALVVTLSRWASVYALPVVVIVGAAVFHGARLVSGASVAEATASGWILDLGGGSLWSFWGGMSPGEVDIAGLTAALPAVGVLIVFSAIALLLQVSGIEVMVREDLDLDRELRITGVANLASGLAGVLPGYHALSLSQLPERAGTRSRGVAVVSATVLLVVLLGGGAVVTLLPTVVLGGLLLLLGYDFVVAWLVRVRHHISRAEYAIVVGITAVIVIWGFLPGIAAGTLAAIGTFVVAYSRVDPIHLEATAATRTSTVDRAAAAREALRTRGDGALILELQGYLFFGTATQVVERWRAALDERPRTAVVLDLSRVTGLDSSAAQSFVRLQQHATAHGAAVALSGLDARALRSLTDGGVSVGADAAVVFADLDHALEWAERRLLADAGVEVPEAVDPRRAIGRFLTDPDQVERLMSYLESVHLGAGDVLVQAGDTARALYLVERGALDVRVGDGRRVRRLGPGSVVGEVAFLTGGGRSATVTAATEACVWRLSEAAWRRMTRRNQRLATAVKHALGVVVAERLVDTVASLEAARR